MNGWVGTSLKVGAVFFSSIALLGADNGRKDKDGSIPLTVPKAVCGPHDNPETALQGQVPAAMRAAGFKGFNCNLELVGQSRGDGANWQTTQFKQRSRDDGDDDDDDGDRDGEHGNKHTRICGYHGTASPTRSLPGRTNLGVPVLDLTDWSLYFSQQPGSLFANVYDAPSDPSIGSRVWKTATCERSVSGQMPQPVAGSSSSAPASVLLPSM